MLTDAIKRQLFSQGFGEINIPNHGINAFAKQIDTEYSLTVNMCYIVNNLKTVHFTVENIIAETIKIEEIFPGAIIKNHYIIITDDVSQDKPIIYEQKNTWFVDTISQNLVIYEHTPEKYFGVENVINSALQNVAGAHQNKVRTSTGSKKIPVITVLLILANIIVFFIMESMGDTENAEFMYSNGAMYWPAVFNEGQYYRLFTCMFMHFGIDHLINNMLALFIVGNQIENILGRFKYLGIYLLSGLGASIISCVYYMMIDVYSIGAGASGAIFGMFGALIVMLYKNKSRIRGASLSRLVILIALLIFGNVSGNIDVAAHLGGAICGMIITALMYKENIDDDIMGYN